MKTEKSLFIPDYSEDSNLLLEFYRLKLQNKEFCSAFSQERGFEMVFNHFFVKENIKENATNVIKAFENIKDPNNFTATDAFNVLKFFSERIKSGEVNDCILDLAVQYITNVFNILSFTHSDLTSYFLKMLKNSSDKITNKIDSEIIGKCFNTLIKSYNDDLEPPPNISFYNLLWEVFNKKEESKEHLFNAITTLIFKNPAYLEKLNSEIPICLWFDSTKILVTDMTDTLTKINKVDGSLAKECIPFVLKHLLEQKSLNLDDVLNILREIESIHCLDPYNSYILGHTFVKEFIEEGNNIFEFPMINQICNRYTDCKDVENIIEHSEDLFSFCLPEKDHFSLFQMFPGNEETQIKKKFERISFWIKFEKEINFRTEVFCSIDDITLETNGSALTLKTKKQNVTLSDNFNATEWNFIYIELVPQFLSSKLLVQINENKSIVNLKQKKTNFSCISLKSNFNIMYLGSSIRITNQDTNNEMLIKNGPGSLEDMGDDDIITTLNYTSKDSFVVSRNFYAVQYFGLPIHFIDKITFIKVIDKLGESESQETFSKILDAILNIASIIKEKAAEEWQIFVDTLAKKKCFINKDKIIKIFRCAKMFINENDIILPFIVHREFWESNEIEMIDAMMEIISQPSLYNFDLFIIQLIVNNSNSNEKERQIIDFMLHNIDKVPGFQFLLLTLLKTSPNFKNSTNYFETLLFRKEDIIQTSIIESLLDYTTEETVDKICTFITLHELCDLITVSSTTMKIKMFSLLTKITKLRIGFFDSSFNDINIFGSGSEEGIAYQLFPEIAKVSHSPDIWRNINQLILLDDMFLPLGLVLIWSYSICYVHYCSFELEKDKSLLEMEKYYIELIDFYMKDICYIVNNEICLSIIIGMFPLIINYITMYTSFIEDEDTSEETEIDYRDFSYFYDLVNDPRNKYFINSGSTLNEREVESFINQFDTAKPLSWMRYISSLISTILDNNKLPHHIQILEKEQNISALKDTKLVNFIVEIILKVPTSRFNIVFESFFFSFQKVLEVRTDQFISILICNILNRIPTEYRKDFPLHNVFRYIHALSSFQLITQSSFCVIQCIYNIFSMLIEKQIDSDLLNKYALDANQLLLFMFQHTNTEKFSQLFSLLTENAQIFSLIIHKSNSLYQWLYVFENLQENKTELSNFIQKVSNVTYFTQNECDIINKIFRKKYDNNDLELMEMEWKKSATLFQKTFLLIKDSLGNTIDYIKTLAKNMSKQENRSKYVINEKHIILWRCLTESINAMTARNYIVEEMYKWDVLSTKIIQTKDYKPSSFFLSSTTFPYCVPKLFVPSPFDIQNPDIPLSMFKGITKEFVSIKTLIKDSSITLLEIFCNINGTPDFIKEATLIRYKKLCPVVLFLYKHKILLLTNFMIKGNDIIPTRNKSMACEKEFIESALIGLWGPKTSIFASKIVIKLPINMIMFIQPLKDNSISLWTYSHGNFILNMQKENSKVLKATLGSINDEAVDSLPYAPFLFRFSKVKEVEEMWSKGKITSLQALLVLNAKESRSFVDLENYVIVPKILNGDELNRYEKDFTLTLPTEKEIINKLKNILPFKLMSKNTEDIPSEFDTALSCCLPEVFREGEDTNKEDLDKVILLNRELESVDFEPHFLNFAEKLFDFKPTEPRKAKRGPRFTSIADFEVKHMFQKLIPQDASSYSYYYDDDRLIRTNSISSILNSCKSTLVSVTKRESVMNIYEITSTKRIAYYKNPLLSYARCIHVSDNGIFICVEYDFGIIEIFRIVYANAIPKSIKSVAQFPLSKEHMLQNRMKSSVSGTDFLCMTSDGNNLILWNIFSQRIFRKFEFESKVLFAAFDEAMFSFWAVTERKIVYMTTNGINIAELCFEDKQITTFEVVQFPFKSGKRYAICGTDKGSLFSILCNFETKEISYIELESPHKAKIEQISIHPTLKAFLSIDAENNAFHWTGYRIMSPKIRKTLVAGCPLCGDECTTLCDSCHRMICPNCVKNEEKGLCQCLTCISYQNE